MGKAQSEGGAPILRPERAPLPVEDRPGVAQRELIGRIVVSPTFARSERMTALLTYVCDMALEGREAELNEQKIGHAVFGRSPDYDSSVDGIVRTQASRLRQRLDLYFQQEGAGESVRIVIPRGGYVPVFEARPAGKPEQNPEVAAPSGVEPAEVSVPADDRKAGTTWRPLGWLALFLLLLAVLGAIGLGLVDNRGLMQERLEAFLHPTPSQRLWKTMFAPGRTTLLVVGDAGANMYENIARKTINEQSYAADSWAAEPEAQTPPGYNWVPIARRLYTPYFAVGFAARLGRMPEVSDGQLSILIARQLRLSELKNSQAILLGGENYDPWEGLLAAHRNFSYVYDPIENSVSIHNAQPERGEAAVYKWRQSDPIPGAGYALITLTHNLRGSGRVLLLQGSTAEGDEAAADFVLDPSRLDPLLARAIAKDGTIDDFEAVLETEFVGGGNVGTTVAAFRVHPSVLPGG